jgi:iron complex outermembrane receptor protein
MSALLLASLLAVAGPLPVAAQQVHAFDVPVQDPASAIRAFGAQAGLQILASADDLTDKHFNPVSGDMSTEQALDTLLAGTGLDHRYVGDRAVALVRNDRQSIDSSRAPRNGAPAEEGVQENYRGRALSPPIEKRASISASADDAQGEKSVKKPAQIDEVVVTGTRQTGVKATDSAAPISVIDAGALQRGGQPDLFQALAQNVPSFNARVFGYDTAALTVSAALRGLSPNDTLVLVDGKRRHSTANLAVDDGSPYSGSAATDLSFIPVGAIDRVEVLQDGAAAQYGSDAIGGVVNIVLKDADHGASISATSGQYYRGDGDSISWTINTGFPIGVRGFVNLTAEQDYHDASQLGGADARFFTQSGTLLPGLSPLISAGVTGAPNSPDVNHQFGDASFDLYKFFYNSGYAFDAAKFYSFGNYGHRVAAAYENYRPPNVVSGVDSDGGTVIPFPNGFNPQEALNENDYSFTVGLKGTTIGWKWDLSSTYGGDKDDIYTNNSANADLFSTLQAASSTAIAPQTDFYDGSFVNSEWTSNLDFNRDFALGFASPLNVAIGGEERKDTFTIDQGEPGSTFGFGAASFPGFQSADQGRHSRSNYAGYVDLAINPVAQWKVDIAARHEHYSDFGQAMVGKFTTRYDFNPLFALRGTLSTGFRAPTLAEEYYSSTGVTPNSADVQLPANSPAGTHAGFSPLRPENSSNYSIGLVARPLDGLHITLDAYQIDIRSRIVNSNFLLGSECSSPAQCSIISQGVIDAIKARGNDINEQGLSYAGISIFSNGASTRTRGAEFTANYTSNFGEIGHVDWSAGLNYNETTVTQLSALPEAVTNVAARQTVLLGPFVLSGLTDATPKVKLILGAYVTYARWNVTLRENIYSPVSQMVSLDGTGSGHPGSPATNARIGSSATTDLDIAYNLTHAIKFAVGADNLFDRMPPGMPNVGNPIAPGQVTPADGHNVYGFPLPFSPFGINGGYYYGRVSYSF